MSFDEQEEKGFMKIPKDVYFTTGEYLHLLLLKLGFYTFLIILVFNIIGWLN